MIDTVLDLTSMLARWANVSVAMKGTIVVTLGLVGVRLARRARASVRHLMLVATFGGLLALPFVLALAPASFLIEVPLIDVRQSPMGATASARASRVEMSAVRVEASPLEGTDDYLDRPTIADFARLGWGLGALAILASLGAALWQLARIRRTGVPWIQGRQLAQSLATDVGMKRRVDVLFHEAVATPLTTGIVRPAILLPNDARDWAESDLCRALVHELEHVRRGDWVLQLLVRVTCALYWFNPLVWIAGRQLCLEAERACDDAVLVNGESTEYAEQLVRLAQRTSTTPQQALAMAKRSDLSGRVSAILDSRQRRGRAGMPTVLTALSTMLVAILSIAPLRAVHVSSNREMSAESKVSTETNVSARPSGSTWPTGAQNRRRGVTLDRALYEAAEEGALDAMNQLLDVGANVDASIDGDGSPLIGAARKGPLDAVRLLLDRGADLNLAVPGDGNPLIMAASEGRLDVVALLLDRGASIERVVVGDENPLIRASANGRLPVVKLLISRGADVNARVWAPRSRDDGEWRTPLSMARRGGHDVVVAYLLSAGAQE